MIQVLADHIDQLDLALDQLAMRDRNFDRFALMLIDNVVELTLHTHAQDTEILNKGWSKAGAPRFDPKTVAEATGSRFDAKAKLAKLTGMVTTDVADSIALLCRQRPAGVPLSPLSPGTRDPPGDFRT